MSLHSRMDISLISSFLNTEPDILQVTQILSREMLQIILLQILGNLKEQLEGHILPGVLDGLERLFYKYQPKRIKALEFPFYRCDSESQKRLDNLKSEFGLTYRFSHDDALKKTTKGLVVAVTNCGDPHAACGNEMGFSSVDGAIAENLKSKGHIFCPCINKIIEEKFVDIHS